MIAPANRLLWAVAVVFLPGALGAAIAPDLLPAMLCAMMAVAVLAAVDAACSPRRLDGITADFSEQQTEDSANGNGGTVFRFTCGRPGKLFVHLHRGATSPSTPLRRGIEEDVAAFRAARAMRVRVGLALPPTFSDTPESIPFYWPAGEESLRVDWEATPKRRGRHGLEGIHLETDSPLGFWKVRRSWAARAELRVYPSLLDERKRFSGLFLHRGGFGVHARRQVGKGRDFEKLREYIPGDSYEDIHWKATARRGLPVTKLFQVERTQEVYVIIDASRLSARIAPNAEDGTSAAQLDRFITAAMVLGLVAEHQGDLYGLLTFSDRIHSFIRARGGRAHHLACRDALYTLEPRQVNPDFEELCAFIHLRLRRRALLVFLTNLDDPVLAESFLEQCRLLSRRHLVLVNSITPPQVRPLFSESGLETPDAMVQALAGHLQWHGLKEIQRGLQRQGVALSLLDTATLSHEVVSQYMRVKERQAL